MAIFGFTDETTALRLKSIAGDPVFVPEVEEADDIVGWVLRTTEEIAAMGDPQSTSESTEIPSGECETWALVEIDDEVFRKKVLNADGDHHIVRACNMSGSSIPTDTFIRASRVVGGAILVDYAPCE